MSTSNYINQTEYNIPLVVFETDGTDEFEYEYIVDLMQDISKDLKHFDISAQSGYYTGMQLYVEPYSAEAKDVDDLIQYGKLSKEGLESIIDYYTLDSDNPSEDELEEAEEIRQEINNELEYIRTKVVKKLLDNGFVKLDVVGTFSNGETVYRYA